VPWANLGAVRLGGDGVTMARRPGEEPFDMLLRVGRQAVATPSSRGAAGRLGSPLSMWYVPVIEARSEPVWACRQEEKRRK